MTPAHPNPQTVWHFLSPDRLDDLLRYSSLTFTLPFLLESQQNDLFEWTYQTLRGQPAEERQQRPGARGFMQAYHQVNLWCHVMSWYQVQNLRLWREQLADGALVAIPSTLEQLHACLVEEESTTEIQLVHYMDLLSAEVPMESHLLQERGFFNREALRVKDASYEGQRELRAFLRPRSARAIEKRRLLKINLRELTTQLVVSPFAPREFFTSLQDRVLVEGLPVEVRWSDHVGGLHCTNVPVAMRQKQGWFSFMGLPLREGEAFPIPPKRAQEVPVEVQQLLEEHFAADADEDVDP